MERTITRIKNLKARRKLSLPASPNPTAAAAAAAAASVASPGRPAAARTESLSVSDEPPYARTRAGRTPSTPVGCAGGVPASVAAQRTASERYRKVQWSPDFRGGGHHHHHQHGQNGVGVGHANGAAVANGGGTARTNGSSPNGVLNGRLPFAGLRHSSSVNVTSPSSSAKGADGKDDACCLLTTKEPLLLVYLVLRKHILMGGCLSRGIAAQ